MDSDGLEGVVKNFDAGRKIGMHLATLKNLASRRLGLSFNKTDTLEAVVAAIKGATPQDVASHNAFPRVVSTEITFHLTTETGCASNLSLDLQVNGKGCCSWGDIASAVVERINETFLRESGNVLFLIAPHHRIPLLKQGDRYVCAQDQSLFTCIVNEATVFSVEAAEPFKRIATDSTGTTPHFPSTSTSLLSEERDRLTDVIVRFRDEHEEAVEKWRTVNNSWMMKMSPAETFELFHGYVYPLLRKAGVLSKTVTMKEFVPVCQRTAGLTQGMLKVAQRLDIPNLDEVVAFVKANRGKKRLRDACKQKGPNAALGELFRVLKEHKVYGGNNSESDA